MKADEIRLANELCQKKCLNTKTVGEHQAGLESLQASMLTEIAAQLSEANKYLKMYANPPIVFEGTDIGPMERMGFNDIPQPIMMAMETRATLRDQFAMAAMQVILARELKGYRPDRNEIAKDAYFYADRLMEARK